MQISTGIVLILGFLNCLLAYTFHNFLWSGSFYDLTTLGFVCYTYVIYNLSKGKWSLLAFVIFLTTINSFLDEILFDPTKIYVNEYLGFILTILITYLYRDRWIK